MPESAMIFHIDYKSGRPFYLQLVDQVRYAGASGALRPKDPLPPIRSVAKQLRINRNTVAKAYAELEALSIIQTIIGAGCFLREYDSPLTPQARRKLLIAKIDEAVVTAHQMQADHGVLRALLDERIQFFETKKTGRKKPAANPRASTATASDSAAANAMAAATDAAGSGIPSEVYLD
ncbi:MAG TPA: GntR family transcriptional regulator [Verrucomicrobiae bacterium]|jgi:GntR family transcriptional regulator